MIDNNYDTNTGATITTEPGFFGSNWKGRGLIIGNFLTNNAINDWGYGGTNVQSMMDIYELGLYGYVGGQVIGAGADLAFSKLGYIPKLIKVPWKFGSRLLQFRNPFVNANGNAVASTEDAFLSATKPKGLADVTTMDIIKDIKVVRPFESQNKILNFFGKITYNIRYGISNKYYTNKARNLDFFGITPGKVFVRRAESLTGKRAESLIIKNFLEEDVSVPALWRFKSRSGREYIYYTRGNSFGTRAFCEECFHSVQRKLGIWGVKEPAYDLWFKTTIVKPYKPIPIEYRKLIEQDAKDFLDIHFKEISNLP